MKNNHLCIKRQIENNSICQCEEKYEKMNDL